MEQSSIICPICQTLNPTRNLYCQSCGKPLVQAAPIPPGSASMFPNPEAIGASSTTSPGTVEPQSPIPMPAYPPAAQPIAPQGYPPQGMAPQPPQGYPPQRISPQGYSTQGMPPQPPQGYPSQGLPPQQGYYPPTPPPPPPPPAAPVLEQLGVRVDGWADLIAGAGDKAEPVQTAFIESFNARELPMAQLEPVNFSTGNAKKLYQVVRTSSGSAAVQIEAKGKDLFLSWSLYVKRSLNRSMIGILAAVAFGISFLTSLSMIGSFGYFIVAWLFGAFNWVMPVAFIALIAGYVWKGSFWYFFLQEPGEMMLDDQAAMVLVVHRSLLEAVEKAGLDSEALQTKNVFKGDSRGRKI